MVSSWRDVRAAAVEGFSFGLGALSAGICVSIVVSAFGAALWGSLGPSVESLWNSDGFRAFANAAVSGVAAGAAGGAMIVTGSSERLANLCKKAWSELCKAVLYERVDPAECERARAKLRKGFPPEFVDLAECGPPIDDAFGPGSAFRFWGADTDAAVHRAMRLGDYLEANAGVSTGERDEALRIRAETDKDDSVDVMEVPEAARSFKPAAVRHREAEIMGVDIDGSLPSTTSGDVASSVKEDGQVVDWPVETDIVKIVDRIAVAERIDAAERIAVARAS